MRQRAIPHWDPHGILAFGTPMFDASIRSQHSSTQHRRSANVSDFKDGLEAYSYPSVVFVSINCVEYVEFCKKEEIHGYPTVKAFRFPPAHPAPLPRIPPLHAILSSSALLSQPKRHIGMSKSADRSSFLKGTVIDSQVKDIVNYVNSHYLSRVPSIFENISEQSPPSQAHEETNLTYIELKSLFRAKVQYDTIYEYSTAHTVIVKHLFSFNDHNTSCYVPCYRSADVLLILLCSQCRCFANIVMQSVSQS